MSYHPSPIVILLAVLLSFNIATITSFSAPRFPTPSHPHQLSSSATATLEPEVVMLEKPSWMESNNVVTTAPSPVQQPAPPQLAIQNPDTTQTQTPTQTRASSKGGISMTVEELAQEFGGDTGKAQLIWDCYAIGVDPTKLYGHMVDLGYDDFESINEMLPKTSRCCLAFEDSVGPQVLATLANLYPVSANGRVENGVAELKQFSHHVAKSKYDDDKTKIVLQLSDGTKVDTYIVPSKESSTLIINTRARGDSSNPSDTTSGRSLSSDEIVTQMFYGRKVSRWDQVPDISNVIVYMGNSDSAPDAEAHAAAVLTAINVLKAKDTFSLRDPSKVQLSMGVYDASSSLSSVLQ